MKIILLAAAVIVAGLANANAASIQPLGKPGWGEARRMLVRYDDLNLSTAKGAADLRRRIEAAVDLACDLPNATQLAQLARVAECRSVAFRDAEARAAQLISTAQSLARRQ